jgi:hypothetical protein
VISGIMEIQSKMNRSIITISHWDISGKQIGTRSVMANSGRGSTALEEFAELFRPLTVYHSLSQVVFKRIR